MLHGWKNNTVRNWDSPFEDDLDPNSCGSGYQGWKWRPEKKMSIAEIRQVHLLIHNIRPTVRKEVGEKINFFRRDVATLSICLNI